MSKTEREQKMIDKTKLTPMMQQYLTIKEQYQDMFVFFRLGDFYELFFDDAIKASKLLEITLTSRAGGEDKIPMCGVPYHAAHTYIQRLIDMGEKIAIVEQTSEPTKGKGLVTREVTKIITPGTFVQEGMFEADSNCYVAAILSENEQHTICYGDISIGKYYYIRNLQNLAAVIDALRIINPLEIVVQEEQHSLFSELFSLFELPKATIETITPTLLETIPAIVCNTFSLLESYLTSVRPDSMLSFQAIFEIEYENAMYMNSTSIASLELFETIKTRNRQGSLLALLDQTKTALGARLLRAWLANPLMSKAQINERLDIVDNLLNNYIERKDLQKKLAKTYDLERLISRISAETAGTRELHQLKITMLALDDIATLLQEAVFHPLIREKWQLIGDLSFVRDELVRALATEDVTSLTDTGLFNPGYSKELDELQEITNGGSQWLLNLEQREKERTGIKNLRVKYNKVFGYFIEISKGNATLVQDDWGYERKQTLSNAERFITEELKQKESQILGAKERLAQLEKQLFLTLCRKITPYRIALQKLADFLAWLDVLQSFAEVSQEYQYVRPTQTDARQVYLQASRHPIIEQVIGSEFIANNVDMTHDDMLLITGPNMAGKSTYMRQIALCSIMHQIGCFVPATRAELPIFDAIYTRIGAQDDLFSGESTFMVEMNEVSGALAHATQASLLLFDEIGRGTATFDGLALAYAIFEYINQHIGAKTLFSTHYHELTDFTKKMPKVRNIHVAASLVNDEIIFHHHIEEGSIEKSYGVQVAKLAHLPERVIDEAKKILTVLEANQPTIDESIIDDENISAILSLNNQNETLQNQNAHYKQLLSEVLAVDLDNLSPRDVVGTLDQLQQKLKGDM